MNRNNYGKKMKMLVTMIFCFSHNYWYIVPKYLVHCTKVVVIELDTEQLPILMTLDISRLLTCIIIYPDLFTCLTFSQTTNYRLLQTERIAANNFKFDENVRKFAKRVENTASKGEIASYVSWCFQKTCAADT